MLALMGRLVFVRSVDDCARTQLYEDRTDGIHYQLTANEAAQAARGGTSKPRTTKVPHEGCAVAQLETAQRR